MSLKAELRRLVQDLDEEANRAFDLWRWLPSEEAATNAHGHYASEFMPSVAGVMAEATLALSILRGYPASKEGVENLFRCQCEECEPETFEQIAERFKAQFGTEIKL